MEIIKRDGKSQIFDSSKIEVAIKKSFLSLGESGKDEKIREMAAELAFAIQMKEKISVEEIQDMVEEKLMEKGFFAAAKSYIKYRAEREKNRSLLHKFREILGDSPLNLALKDAGERFAEDEYSLMLLFQKFSSFLNEGLSKHETENQLIKAAVELTSKEAPRWEYIAARLLAKQIYADIEKVWSGAGVDSGSFYNRLRYLETEGLLGEYILENYSEAEVAELYEYIDFSRDNLFTYSGLDLLFKRYLIRTLGGKVLENMQEMFITVAMHLAISEGGGKIAFAKQLYDIISQFKVTLATPTLSNARKPYNQLSSCFIDTVPDSLDGIYRSIDSFAKVSKFGGGMGLYFGKVRAIGSDIRGFKGAAGGVIRWIKLANDTAVAVDQLGVRQGSVAIYLDAWHKDLPEFLALRTNNGDDRMKAHDVFPAICYPDYFWELVEKNIDADWYLMCPHEIKKAKGYSLEDSFGAEWAEKYHDCIRDERISKRVITVKNLVRLIIKSATETGTPFVFNRDKVNKMNPNPHKGMIYSSNLCTEIAQNMSENRELSTEIIKDENGDDIVVSKVKSGDFVVCNLASLVLGNLDVENQTELRATIRTIVRALDNVVDLNYYPVDFAEITNKKYRSIGLGVNGYHHMLVNNGIAWNSERHLEFADKIMENINFYAIEASNDLAIEKGSYSYFEGSDWQNGDYFDKRGYESERWNKLRADVAEGGLRNAYLLAIAPTSSTSIIAGTTASVDPIMNKYFLEEKKGMLVPRVAPNLNPKNFLLYQAAHEVDQIQLIRAAGVRGRHIDQAQSLNLYITTDFTMREVLELYLEAWRSEVKTIYYIRSKSLEIEDCDTCSA